MFQLFFDSQCVNGRCQAPSSGLCSPTSPGGSCSNANERVIVTWRCVGERVDNVERVCSVSMVLAKSVRWLQPLVNCLMMRVGSQSNVVVTALLRVLLRFLILRFIFCLSGAQQPRFLWLQPSNAPCSSTNLSGVCSSSVQKFVFCHQTNDFVADVLRKKKYKMWKRCVRGFVGHRIAMFERQHTRGVRHSRSKVFVERQRSFVSSTCSSFSIASNDANVALLRRRCAATMRRLACARQQVSRALLNPTPAALFTLVKYAVDSFFPFQALFKNCFRCVCDTGSRTSAEMLSVQSTRSMSSWATMSTGGRRWLFVRISRLSRVCFVLQLICFTLFVAGVRRRHKHRLRLPVKRAISLLNCVVWHAHKALSRVAIVNRARRMCGVAAHTRFFFKQKFTIMLHIFLVVIHCRPLTKVPPQRSFPHYSSPSSLPSSHFFIKQNKNCLFLFYWFYSFLLRLRRQRQINRLNKIDQIYTVGSLFSRICITSQLIL